MSQPIDLTGRTFGNLKVVERSGSNARGSAMWLCQCSCGNSHRVVGLLLARGSVKSCGCRRKHSFGLATKMHVLRNYQHSAERRGLEFVLTPGQFFKLTQLPCHYCGKPPGKSVTASQPKLKNGDFLYNGLDRVDSRKGYTIENTVPCCTTCNYAKGTATAEEFTSWVKLVHKHLCEVNGNG